MGYHYVYATNGTDMRPGPSLVGSAELTAAQAEKIYHKPVGSQGVRTRFAVIRVDETTGRHVAVMELAPGANGVRLWVVNEYKSTVHIYGWGAYFVPLFTEKNPVYQGSVDSVFLRSVAHYAYPDEPRHFHLNESDVLHSIDYRENGEVHVMIREYVGPERIRQTETTEYKDIDVSDHYYKIPEFGQWDGFFNVHEPFALEHAQKMLDLSE